MRLREPQGARCGRASARALRRRGGARSRPVPHRGRGEVRGFAYYTGTTFSIYADGPGEPIGAGGRYDELLSRFGAPMAAVGFGLDLDALAWALRSAGAPALGHEGVVYVGTSDDGRVAALRARGVPTVAVAYHDAALAHARSWRFAAVWSGATLFDVRSETASAFDGHGDADRVAGVVARMLESLPRGA